MKECILKILQDKKYTGIFVEIGTWTGQFAETLLNNTHCTRLFCVDPYKHFDDLSYPDYINTQLQTGGDTYFYKTKSHLEEQFGSRVTLVRKSSMEAVNDFQESSLDFVYIDGNHEYSHVLEDILAWFPKIKSGGILAGDDIYSRNIQEYTNNNMLIHFGGDEPSWGVFGVYPAVLEAQRLLGIQFTIQGTQFYYVKS